MSSRETDPPAPNPTLSGSGSLARFWDDKARWNSHVAILGGAEIEDPATRDGAFAQKGKEDALRLWPFLCDARVVVDVGSGIGRILKEIAPSVERAVGVDISGEMLEQARGYLGDAPNVELVLGDGRTLASLETGSVDFLYCSLCLIHVDRRSAWSYLQEIQRVLKDSGAAWLQFQNILSPVGWRKFVSVADSDYPLELYTEDELRFFLSNAGLNTLTLYEEAEFFAVTALKGSTEAYLRGYAESIEVREHEKTGCFETGLADGTVGSLRFTVSNVGAAKRRLFVRFHLTDEATGAMAWAGTVGIELLPGASTRVEFVLDASDPDRSHVLLDEDPAPLQKFEAHGSLRPGTRYVATLAACPPGIEFVAGFPAALVGLMDSQSWAL